LPSKYTASAKDQVAALAGHAHLLGSLPLLPPTTAKSSELEGKEVEFEA